MPYITAQKIDIIKPQKNAKQSIKHFKTLLFGIIICAVYNQCTVNYSFTGASIPIEAKTFSVKTFDNQAPTVNPQLSNTITDQLFMRLSTSTSLVPNPLDADIAFEGTITNYHLTPIALQGGDATIAAQNRLTIGVKVKFQNRYDSKSNFDTSFSQYADFDSNADLSSIEDALVDEIVEKLVTDIFNKALVNW
jgi:hypothetical protein